MSLVETVEVSELGSRSLLHDALRDWRGFAELWPASEALATKPWLKLGNAPNSVWEWTGGIAAAPLAPIGCFFLRDVEVSGAGYLFSGGRFIREHTHTSDVAMNRINEHYPGNPLDSRRTNIVTIDEPVLMITGAGNPTYGHWILDFLPRLVIAQLLLGPSSRDLPILLPATTPDWVRRMLKAYCGVSSQRLRFYSEQNDMVFCRTLCLPSFAHDGNYSLHGSVRSFFSALAGSIGHPADRRLCLSRKSFSEGRVFANRDLLERIATSRGYEIVRPEELGFAEQAELYGSASCIVGEAGSGLHGSVFSQPGTIVASVGFNWVQAHVSGAFEQKLIFMERLQPAGNAGSGIQSFAATEIDLVGLFDQVDRLRNDSRTG